MKVHNMVIINSNGTLLTPAWQAVLVESGLDQYRCSIDGAKPETYALIRGANLLHKLTAGLGGLVKTKARLQSKTPQISIWCMGTQENLAELPDLVRLVASACPAEGQRPACRVGSDHQARFNPFNGYSSHICPTNSQPRVR